jgi:cytochrome o ubiquinol oxidase operon protein cyoD
MIHDGAPEPDRHDIAPGDESADGEHHLAHGLRGYTLGLLLAIALTIASFVVADARGPIWGPAVPAAIIVLGVAQMGIHLVFFLHLTTGPDNTNNVLALAFGVLIVFLVIAGSLWIMANLDQRMMPMSQIMAMQR